MKSNVSHPRVSKLYRYSIASSDMYYAEVEQRDVYVSDDPLKGFRIWGEIPGIGPASSIDLCQMFLEYAMYYRSWYNQDEAVANVNRFGEMLGAALARFLKDAMPVEANMSPGACALMCMLEALNIQLTVEQVGPEMHFMFAACPLFDVAQRTSLQDADLALYGVNSMCQALVHNIDPYLAILTPLEVRPNFVLSVGWEV